MIIPNLNVQYTLMTDLGLFHGHQREAPAIVLVCRESVLGQRTVAPTVVSGKPLLLHVDADFHEVARRDVVDVGHAAQHVLGFSLIAVGDFGRREVAPLIGAVGVFFRVKVFNGIAQGVETDGLIGANEQSPAVFAAQFHPAGIGAVAVFLWSYIVIGVHYLGGGAVEIHESGGVAVNVVLARPATEVFHAVHVGGQTETHADARHVGLVFLRREGDVGVHHAIGMDGVFHDVRITCGEEIVGCERRFVTVALGADIRHAEILARLLPNLFALGLSVSIVVVGRRAPEVGLDAEAVGKVFRAVHLVRGDHAALLVENELHAR